MPSSSARARIGDVYSVATPLATAVIHYVGVHPEYGDAIRVCQTDYRSEEQLTDDLFTESVFTFYPLNASLKRGLITRVGHLRSPGMPRRLRRAGARSGNQVMTWVVESEEGEVVRRELSAEELLLPIAAIWTHDMLVHRITERLQASSGAQAPSERQGADAQAELQRRTVHYVYTRDQRTAEGISRKLSDRGFQVESRPGSDGEDWLVLARHTGGAGDDMLAKMSVIESVVQDLGAEYDGHEVEFGQG